jgi:hypothetical protein
MVAVVLSLLLITAVALVVVGVVAVPARRAGREVLTRRGASTLDSLRDRVTPGRSADEDVASAPAPALDADEPVRLSA